MSTLEQNSERERERERMREKREERGKGEKGEGPEGREKEARQTKHTKEYKFYLANNPLRPFEAVEVGGKPHGSGRGGGFPQAGGGNCDEGIHANGSFGVFRRVVEGEPLATVWERTSRLSLLI